MRFFLFLPVLFVGISKAASPDSGKFKLNFGYGMYEAIHAGLSYNYRDNLSIRLSAGSDFKIFNNDKYWSIVLEHDWIFRRFHDNKLQLSPFSLNKKVIFWYLDDGYYVWKVLSFQPAFAVTLPVHSRWKLECDAGPVFMVVLDFNRKTFEHVGWPKYFMFNGSVKWVYSF